MFSGEGWRGIISDIICIIFNDFILKKIKIGNPPISLPLWERFKIILRRRIMNLVLSAAQISRSLVRGTIDPCIKGDRVHSFRRVKEFRVSLCSRRSEQRVFGVQLLSYGIINNALNRWRLLRSTGLCLYQRFPVQIRNWHFRREVSSINLSPLIIKFGVDIVHCWFVLMLCLGSILKTTSENVASKWLLFRRTSSGLSSLLSLSRLGLLKMPLTGKV